MPDLIQRSLEVILKNQHPLGAYIASPEFAPYRYSWFRDGSYIAYTMDLYGESESAFRFHDWASKVICERGDVVERAVAKAASGDINKNLDTLHTRFTLEGQESSEEWPNFQLDGFGTWLWSLAEHRRLSGQEPSATCLEAAEWIAEYLSALWKIPCFDCWEEYPDKVHAHTLASIRGGLKAYGRISGDNRSRTIDEIDLYMKRELLRGDHFVKFVGSKEVDASLLGLATPFCYLNPDDPLMLATVSRIEEDLMGGGGLHRYRRDTYYGGGEWVLLTAWLGWYHVERGNIERARQLLEWVEHQADEHGHLPEQVPFNLNDSSYLQPWRERWGESARPLLWSHAKYLILQHAIASV